MENGLFNNVFRIGHYIIKISKSDNDITNEIMTEMNSRNPNEYSTDINNVGIKTAKVVSFFNFYKYDILIQEFINGKSIQTIFEEENIPTGDKVHLFEMFIEIYIKSQKNDNLCLDWNMNNFLYSDEEIYYVDLTPCLYIDKIEKSQSKKLIQYREGYLNKNIQLAGILGYAIMPFINYLPKSKVNIVFNKFVHIIREKVDFCLNEVPEKHVYFYKLNQINQYLNSDLSYEEMKRNISIYSMKNTFNCTEANDDLVRIRHEKKVIE